MFKTKRKQTKAKQRNALPGRTRPPESRHQPHRQPPRTERQLLPVRGKKNYNKLTTLKDV